MQGFSQLGANRRTGQPGHSDECPNGPLYEMKKTSNFKYEELCNEYMKELAVKQWVYRKFRAILTSLPHRFTLFRIHGSFYSNCARAKKFSNSSPDFLHSILFIIFICFNQLLFCLCALFCVLYLGSNILHIFFCIVSIHAILIYIPMLNVNAHILSCSSFFSSKHVVLLIVIYLLY